MQVSNDGNAKDEIFRLLKSRFDLGRERYGHGVKVDQDASEHGVGSNNWELMSLEEMLDGLVYTAASIIRVLRRTGEITSTTSANGDDNDEILQIISDRINVTQSFDSNWESKSLTKMLDVLISVTVSIIEHMRHKDRST